MAPGRDIALLQSKDVTTTTASIPIACQPSKTGPEISITELPPTPPELNQHLQLPLQSILVLDPALITQEFDLLRFEAAAFDQLPTSLTTSDPDSTPDSDPDFPINHTSTKSSPSSTSLISSPYNTPGHYLSLPALPPSSLLFALALTALKPIRSDYATAPYPSALNFPRVLSVLRDLCAQSNYPWRETSFYVVVFRSKLKDGIDNDWLYKLDYESHAEACESGGLLKYWFGKSDAERRNLATCFWHSRADAYQGGLGPWHKKARAAGRELYERIVFSTHRFTVLDGAEEYRFEEWVE